VRFCLQSASSDRPQPGFADRVARHEATLLTNGERIRARDRGAKMQSDFLVIARRETTKQSSFLAGAPMDCFAGARNDAKKREGYERADPHSSLALVNAKEETRRVFSSRIKVRVIGGSARWLQFSRSQSRQFTPIGVPSVFSRSIPVA